MDNEKIDTVAILDAGAQYGKLIDRVVRSLNVKTVILPLSTPVSEIKNAGYKAIILSGSPQSLCNKDVSICDERLLECGIPILGICYGMQVICHLRGCEIKASSVREDGQFEIEIIANDCKLFEGIETKQKVLLTHGDSVIGDLPPSSNLRITAKSSNNLIAAVSDDEKRIFGVQFHPETQLTLCGKQVFQNFLFAIVGCNPNFTLSAREDICIDYIKACMPSSDHIVFVLVSGGVDSTVCAALLSKALGTSRVYPVHIDHGFMRERESEEIIQNLKEAGIVQDEKTFTFVDASDIFRHSTTLIPVKDPASDLKFEQSHRLCDTTDPEEKRQIIGDTFIKIIKNIMSKQLISKDRILLAQGTLRPDLIESASHMASSSADVIKTHHNDSTLVRQLRAEGKVIEPLKDFHKDEVRELGRLLKLPESIVNRHPFPGPGLAIRILCCDESFIERSFHASNKKLKVIATFRKSIDLLQKSGTDERDDNNESIELETIINFIRETLDEKECEEVLEITRRMDIEAMLLPIRTVGVQGDCRSYSYAAALSSNDAVVWSDMMRMAQLIPKILHNVNRVVFAFGGKFKEESVYQLTKTHLVPTTVDLLRYCDKIANKVLIDHDCYNNLSQMPIILLPIQFDRRQTSQVSPLQYSVVIRTFISSDFMTGTPAVPGIDIPLEAVNEMYRRLASVDRISRVLYDLTAKPPGTTEWE